MAEIHPSHIRLNQRILNFLFIYLFDVVMNKQIRIHVAFTSIYVHNDRVIFMYIDWSHWLLP